MLLLSSSSFLPFNEPLFNYLWCYQNRHLRVMKIILFCKQDYVRQSQSYAICNLNQSSAKIAHLILKYMLMHYS
ncbi:hypothetical protein BVRB_8g197330 [Beta vulgaris subsp. vulgaris]|nr:hypothetical protein BVRB_8g197330 [Beta vulgaris subsp. vulgaris]